MTEKQARLTVDGMEQPIELPVHEGTSGPDVIDVSNLVSNGIFTYDPGFLSTASCDSSITYIDGEAGVLLHRGYPIEQLAANSSFLETCYLLLYGELPEAGRRAEFEADLAHHAMLDGQLSRFFHCLPRDAHPMAMLCGVTGALSAFYQDELDIENPEHRLLAAHRLIATMPTLAAMCYRYSVDRPFVSPRDDLGFTENFLHMMFAASDENARVSPVLSKAMDTILLLHADHEQNASTSTVRLAGSTGANPCVCIAAGIAALWGAAHGGANQAVLEMLREIGDESNIDEFIARARDKDDPFRLMGFGHRVYKNYDPRATVIRRICDEVLDELGSDDDPLFRVARKLEKIALEDAYFVERKLFPNVDFYSGIILKAMGIPSSLFTVIFAVGRTPGWIAHWNEMLSNPYRIGRPRQLYKGYPRRDYPS